MNKEDKDEIERLLSLKIATFPDKSSAQEMIRKYINPGAHYCMTCDPAIRQMFSVLRGWWSKQNKDVYQFIAPVVRTKR